MTTIDPAHYRPCVGIALFNAQNQVFVGRRLDTKVEAWQMPQGGIEPGEAPRTAAFREMEEEIGTNQAELLIELPDWYHYDLPAPLQKTLWNGQYVGQRQRWFGLRFTGTDADININTAVPEFREWRWVDLDLVPGLIVPFKKRLYEEVCLQFVRHLYV